MRAPISQLDSQSKELKAIEKELRGKALIFRSNVKSLVKTAYTTYSQAIYDSVTNRLRLTLETYETESLRKPDPFRPYGPEQLLNQGDLYLMDQINVTPFKINPNKLLTGMLVVGPQGSGKSRLIRHICNEFKRVNPSIKITLIDPKNGFGNLQGFKHLDLDNISLDLEAPSNADQNNFIYEFLPILAQTCSLIFSLNLINQAADIALSQLQHYTKQARMKTTLCVRDIYEALLTIKVKNYRELGYHDSARTALLLIIGKHNLFSCRKGLSLENLFNENTVINARSLTHEMQCKVFVNYILYWLYQQAKNLPECKEIQRVIIIDDASRFIGIDHQYDANRRTSPLGHLLAVLRATGTCCIFATQIPSQIDPAVLSLCRNMAVVGNINGEDNLRVIQSFMSLTPEQKNAILRFQTREVLSFISGSAWPYPVHGWAPFIEDTPTTNPACHYPSIITPWHPLTEIPQQKTEQVSSKTTENKKPALKSSVGKLVWDCITYPFDKVRERTKRLDFSIRIYETAKNTAIQDEYLLYSTSGKSVYLIPTQKAYDKYNIPCPYERNASIEHSFYVQLAAHILKKSAAFSKVQTETPIGDKGASIDVTTIDMSGKLTAYEMTLSTGNLLSNATKLQDTAYQKIIWLCKDAATAISVKSYFNKSSALPESLTAKFEYLHFSKLSKQYKEKK